MTVQAENVYSIAASQVQLKNNLLLLSVDIDKDDHVISEIAQRIFTTHYDKVFEIKNARSIELSDLIKQKHSLEKSWGYYLFNGSYTCKGLPRFYEICFLNFAGMSCVGLGLVMSNSNTSNQFLVGVGIVGSTFAIIPSAIFASFLPCTNIVKNFLTLSIKISNIQKKEREIRQLIKFTNIFAEFCEKWPKIVPETENGDKIKVFKLLKDILKEYDADIVKIAGQKFLHLAPLFLMEKVCSLCPTGELATSWKHIKTSPELWKNNDLWEKVQLNNPSGTDYIDFFETVDKNGEADPSNWRMWFEKKLDLYIQKSEI